MNYLFPNFKKVLSKLDFKEETEVKCPVNNAFCLKGFLDCDKGKNNSCTQYYKFYIKNSYYTIIVYFQGEDRKGFVKTEELSIRNIMNKYRDSFEAYNYSEIH